MSEIRWCDAGSHPFPKGKDPDDREYAETSTDDRGRRNFIDVCGPCSRSSADVTTKALVSADAVPAKK